MATLPDTQSEPDLRQVAIQQVGIKALRYPIHAHGQPTVGTFALTVALPAEERGTHMSRFVKLVQEYHQNLTPASLVKMTTQLAKTLGSHAARIEVSFPYFLTKSAPVTGQQGQLDYQVTWICELQPGTPVPRLTQQVIIPVATLCPCSKAISDRGAHNQRGHLTLSVQASPAPKLEKIISLGEASASCELYSVLKRPDEKAVTERAYDNPTFVEDVVRSAAVRLRKLKGIQGFQIEAENFESIHNHNAYAVVKEGE